MILSIITINRNNASGLEKTLKSVLNQTRVDFEFIIVDGNSSDESVKVIQNYEKSFEKRLRWISEPDSGIYNAMNKGIGMASGNYVQILNSGDCLVSPEVVEKIYYALEKKGNPAILYGNMLKDMPGGEIIKDKGFAGEPITFLGFYTGTLNHPSAYTRKDLFDKYGLYDENLNIVSDWKWFLQAIVLGGEVPVYTDIDVSLFDMTGISENNKDLTAFERNKVLEQIIPVAILSDYKQWSSSISRMRRIERYPWANRIVWFIERCLFKLEKYCNASYHCRSRI